MAFGLGIMSSNLWFYSFSAFAIAFPFLYFLSLRRFSFSFAKKHVVITGGSSGIGKAIAAQALKLGSTVTLIARNEQKLKSAQEELKPLVQEGEKLLIVSLDVSHNLSNIEKAFEQLVKDATKPVDVLVNCAGTSIPGVFDELDPGAFEQMMRVNYFGSVYPTRAVVPSMKQRITGRIVFVSSQAGQIGLFGFSAYTPSKFALVGFAQVLRMELKSHGIKVCVAYPPDTDTPGFETENKCKPEETKLLSEVAGLFTPQEVASNIMTGIQGGDFTIYTGLDGWMLGNVTAGMSAPNSLFHGLYQVCITSLLRLIAIGYSFHFDRILEGCRKAKDNKKTK